MVSQTSFIRQPQFLILVVLFDAGRVSSLQDVEVNVRVIYMLHNILVEEQRTPEEHVRMEKRLKEYFKSSRQIFSENSEYLFFIDRILHIAESYFDVDDDLKSTKENLAFKMQKKAREMELDNKLYELGYVSSKGEKERVFLLLKKLL